MDPFLLLAVFISFWIAYWLISLVINHDRAKNFEVPVRDISKGHHWVYVEAFEPGHYCNVCETSTFHGAQCDFCGIIVDSQCMKKADAAIACKSLACIGSMKHHWVNGNLPHWRSVCSVCEDPCGDGPGLQDYRCCWCQIALHKHCMGSYTAICDLGKWKKMIVPPNSVRLKLVGWKGNRHFVVKEVVKPNIVDWSPVLVVGNRKSGNGEGDVVLQSFRRILNPAQVLDLAEMSPEFGLEWCHLIPDVKCRVLVAGGDGTVGWVLSTIESLGLSPSPQVGILPIGTGNDLSRVLGWGSGHTGPVDPHLALQLFARATPAQLDRWHINISHRRHFGIKKQDTSLTMNNYMSIGVDALVTLNFHNKRNSLPRVMSSRFVNKLLFFHYGTMDLLERGCKDLDKSVELFMDGSKVDLPGLEGIVILNIPCWGAGVRPWEMGRRLGGAAECPDQAIDDGLVEVFGLYSSFHIAQLQVGLSEPHRFGQAKEVLIKLRSQVPIPMQVDGEPWLQRSAIIKIREGMKLRFVKSSILCIELLHTPEALLHTTEAWFRRVKFYLHSLLARKLACIVSISVCIS